MRHKLPFTAFALGLSGLIPQMIACYFAFSGGEASFAALAGLSYAALILSFLGGLWWGVAAARNDAALWLYCLGVCPSLIAFAAILGHGLQASAPPYVLVGVTLLLTPLVDAVVERRGYVPVGWLKMRLILSTGLGLMTLLLALKT